MGPPPHESSLESPAWNLILKHSPYFRSSFSLQFNHRITSVSFLHFPHKGVLSSGALRHGSFEETVQHHFLVQPTSPKNEGTFQELAENAHPSLPSVLLMNVSSLRSIFTSKPQIHIEPEPSTL